MQWMSGMDAGILFLWVWVMLHNTQINPMQLYFSIARVFPSFLPSTIHPTLFQNGLVLPLLSISIIVHSYKISEAEQTKLSSFYTL